MRQVAMVRSDIPVRDPLPPEVRIMPISLPCPGCSATLKAPDKAAGRTLTCPNCKTPVLIPGEPPLPEPPPLPPTAHSATPPANKPTTASRKPPPLTGVFKPTEHTGAAGDL